MSRNSIMHKTKRALRHIGEVSTSQKKEAFDRLRKIYLGEIDSLGTRIKVSEGDVTERAVLEIVGVKDSAYVGVVRFSKLRGFAYISREKIGNELKPVIIKHGAVGPDVIERLKEIAKTNISRMKQSGRIETPINEISVRIGFERGMEPKEIAEFSGMELSTVHNVAKRLGIKFNSKRKSS